MRTNNTQNCNNKSKIICSSKDHLIYINKTKFSVSICCSLKYLHQPFCSKCNVITLTSVTTDIELYSSSKEKKG